ncbi:hypothetical protein RRG08_033756 [Elysia crispata]|uniref:Uncharacterized protein n=1 Tax=Elysia crispata TaxID=231223 RepID=A0AAE1ARV1_9GAST|nr:hypothetical protein RRG08_033756 [Elysia crispata]
MVPTISGFGTKTSQTSDRVESGLSLRQYLKLVGATPCQCLSSSFSNLLFFKLQRRYPQPTMRNFTYFPVAPLIRLVGWCGSRFGGGGDEDRIRQLYGKDKGRLVDMPNNTGEGTVCQGIEQVVNRSAQA